MDTNFVLTRSKQSDGKLVSFGPLDQASMTQLSIPETITRVVNYPALELEVEITCRFSGERLEVTNMNIRGHGTYIATAALTKLSLPQVIRAVALEAIPNVAHWTNPKPEFLDGNRAFLAQVYWLEHASWGAPRTAIMELKGWSRPNTSFHIKGIAKEFQLPGAHAAQSEKQKQLRKQGREVPMEKLIESLS